MQTYEQRRPSKKLTNHVIEAYNINQKRLKADRKARALEVDKKVLEQKMLELINQGYTIVSGSEYGVLITEESETPQYKVLYNTLIQRLVKKIPEHQEYITRTAERLVKQSLKNIKHSVVYDTNENLEKKIKSIEDPKEAQKRNGIKKVNLVLYT